MRILTFLVYIPLMPLVLKALYRPSAKKHSVSFWGLNFPNPVGLAAGFDKDGKYIRALSCLGFGYIEVGTVTPRPQTGNPKPRLFRLKKSKALINRMGFNNEGCDKLVARLRKLRKAGVVIGANIGKNKATPNQHAVDDYLYCFRKLHPYADYFVVNVSSPNTPGLRELQERKPLTRILEAIQHENHSLEQPKPLLLKIAPDLTDEQLEDIADIVQETKLAGVIATNTTVSRDGLLEDADHVADIGAGGLSGRPLTKSSTDIVARLRILGKDRFTVIGVGGIFDSVDAREKMDAGAGLLQVYTGFIYKGPAIVKRILRDL